MKITIAQIKDTIKQLNNCKDDKEIFRFLMTQWTPFYLWLDNDSTGIRILFDCLEASEEELKVLAGELIDEDTEDNEIEGYALEALEETITVKIVDWLGYGPGVETILDIVGIKWENC